MFLSAFQTFNVDPKEGLKVQLFDNLSTPIHADIFELVVKSFGNGSTFFINLVYETDLDGAKKMVTPEVSLFEFTIKYKISCYVFDPNLQLLDPRKILAGQKRQHYFRRIQWNRRLDRKNTTSIG